MNRSRVSVIRCETYNTKEVEAAVKKAVGFLGGIENFVKPNSRVLIKPNLLSRTLNLSGRWGGLSGVLHRIFLSEIHRGGLN